MSRRNEEERSGGGGGKDKLPKNEDSEKKSIPCGDWPKLGKDVV